MTLIFNKNFILIAAISCCLVGFSKSILAQDEIKTQSVRETDIITERFKDFLRWYKVHYSRANSFKMVKEDKDGFFRVDLKACDQYLDYLKSSTFISDAYVDIWRDYFISRYEYLEEYLQNEGPPEGFEFDLVLISQEPTLVLDAVDELQYVTTLIAPSNALISVIGEFEYEIELSKINGIWMIDYISTMNFD